MMRHIVLMAPMLAVAGIGAALAGGPYDGTCHGTLTAEGMNAMSCAKSAPVQMTVTDSKLEYHHFSNATIMAPVAADGSFSGSAQTNTPVVVLALRRSRRSMARYPATRSRRKPRSATAAHTH
jgi:hypothetical protein